MSLKSIQTLLINRYITMKRGDYYELVQSALGILCDFATSKLCHLHWLERNRSINSTFAEVALWDAFMEPRYKSAS